MTYQDESALPFSDHVSKLDGPAKFLKWNSHGPALRQRKRRLQPLPAAARHAGKAWSLRLATFGRRGSSGVRCEKYRLEAYATLNRAQSAWLRRNELRIKILFAAERQGIRFEGDLGGFYVESEEDFSTLVLRPVRGFRTVF